MTEPTVLHDDRQWLVLNKPAGWHCVETNTDGRPVVETGCENSSTPAEIARSRTLPSP